MRAPKARDWKGEVKGLLKAELKRRNLSYGDLVDKLAKFGVVEDKRNISNKVSRGTFTAIFMLQCLVAIGCHNLHLGDDQ